MHSLKQNVDDDDEFCDRHGYDLTWAICMAWLLFRSHILAVLSQDAVNTLLPSCSSRTDVMLTGFIFHCTFNQFDKQDGHVKEEEEMLKWEKCNCNIIHHYVASLVINLFQRGEANYG